MYKMLGWRHIMWRQQIEGPAGGYISPLLRNRDLSMPYKSRIHFDLFTLGLLKDPLLIIEISTDKEHSQQKADLVEARKILSPIWTNGERCTT